AGAVGDDGRWKLGILAERFGKGGSGLLAPGGSEIKQARGGMPFSVVGGQLMVVIFFIDRDRDEIDALVREFILQALLDGQVLFAGRAPGCKRCVNAQARAGFGAGIRGGQRKRGPVGDQYRWSSPLHTIRTLRERYARRSIGRVLVNREERSFGHIFRGAGCS